MPYIGSTPNASFSTRTKQDFTANGSTTAFTLSSAVASANDIEVFVGNVRQEPTDAYTVNGTTLTMSAAPANGINFYVVFKGLEENSVVPADGTISSAKIATNAVTTAKIGASQITDAKIATGITATKLSGDINYSNLPVGSVVQTIHTNAGSQAVTAGPTTLQTGTITPKFASSKILMITNMNFHINSAGGAYWRVQYNYSIAGGASGTATLGNNYLADAVGYPNNVFATGTRMHYGGQKLFPSYNTTSAITFTVVVTRQGSSAGELGAGYNHNNDMTLMEIKQ